ncbi:MAG TPA: acyl-CoA dehydrogenase family protein [Kofleriaceae bacterium]|jgi:alkylation response protein AidB-like acyl-CoA dehydrogenase
MEFDVWQPRVDAAFAKHVADTVARVVAPEADRIDREDFYPTDIVRALAKAGFTAATFPTEHGGGGRPFADLVAIFEEVAAASAATATSLITIFQAGETIHLFGSDALQAKYLPRIAQGLLCSFAMTEARGGSDVKKLDTKARRDGEHWVLDGKKAFVTSASAAELFVILAETEKGVTCFAVPADTPGARLEAPPSTRTIGLRNGPHVDLILEGARLPADHIIGEEGKGIRAAATTLDHSRVLAAAIGCGIARAAFSGALHFADKRSVFGQYVIELQGIQWYLAELLAKIDSARLLTYEAAARLDAQSHTHQLPRDSDVRKRGLLDIQRWSSSAKLIATKTAVEASLQAIQICGVRGCLETAPFGRYLRDAKTYEIAGGSSEILKNTLGEYLVEAVDGPG